MTLDYQAKTMTFVPNGYKPPDVMEAMMTAIIAAGSAASRRCWRRPRSGA